MAIAMEIASFISIKGSAMKEVEVKFEGSLSLVQPSDNNLLLSSLSAAGICFAYLIVTNPSTEHSLFSE